MKQLTVLVIIGLVIWGCVSLFDNLKPDKWSLMYENDFGMIIVAGNYDSREECSNKLQLARHNPAMGRPECGSNCNPPTTINGPYVCDDTFEL